MSIGWLGKHENNDFLNFSLSSFPVVNIVIGKKEGKNAFSLKILVKIHSNCMYILLQVFALSFNQYIWRTYRVLVDLWITLKHVEVRKMLVGESVFDKF